MEKEYVESKNNYYSIFNFSYYFTYQGEQYEVNLTFAGEEIQGKMSIDNNNPELTFKVQKEEFDKKEIRENVEKYVQEYLKDDNIHVYSDEYVKISFLITKMIELYFNSVNMITS